MAYSNLEKEVINNAKELDKLLPEYMNSHQGKYAIFYSNELLFSTTYEKAMEKGENSFGAEKGFVVKKVTKSIPVFSSIVKL